MKRPWLWGIGIAIVSLGLFFCLVLVFLFAASNNNGITFGNAVAVLEVNGPIAQADDLLRDIEKVRTTDNYRGVVLRVNSPGGSVGASQEMYHALQRLAEEKPLVASFGSIAASGGYYIGLAAKQIFALPGTLTASIGVRMSHLEAEELIRALGLKPEILKSGYFKDVGAMHRPMRDDERALLQHLLDTMHLQFKTAVATSRKLPMEKVDLIADGRVMVGSDALAAGLIDTIGDLQDAIVAVGTMAGLGKDPKVVRIHDDRPWWMELMKSSAGFFENRLVALIDGLRRPSFGYYVDPFNSLEGASAAER